MPRVRLYHALVFLCILWSAAKPAHADEAARSTDYMGLIGLNTIPSARMDEEGTMRAGASHADPHNHVFIGLQVAKPLYINLRQSMLVSSVGDKPSLVYPGMDIKLRLKKEGRYMPEISFGMNSALGDSRFSSEYFALSKRWYDFDFTAGVGWGRLGSAGHLKNPFAGLSSHFDKERDFSSADAASPSDWFTGEEIGFFGGVEYFTPIKGLSLKADFNADAYKAETRQFDFKKPSPWSFGFNYSPKDWISFGASVIGMDKIMARLTFQTNPYKWKTQSYKDSSAFKFDGKRPDATWRQLAREMAEADSINMGKTRIKGHDFSGVVHMNDYELGALQIGRVARHLAANAGPEIETITVIPVTNGLRGKTVTFSRRDLEQAVAQGQGSPEEIWRDISFDTDTRSISRKSAKEKFKFHPELKLSIGEEETTHLYKASFVAETTKQWKHGIYTGASLRFNIANNLHRLQKFRDVNTESIRAHEDLFARNRVNIDRAFLSWLKTPLPDFHMALTAGFLEEMYAGYGGEVLYRPFQSPFAIGAEAWNLYLRDPTMPLAATLVPGDHFTAHLNLFYEIPDTDVTAFAKVGRFIGGDNGVSFGAQTQLNNGIKAKAFMNVTDMDNKDVFGSDRNVYAGINVAIPLGNLKFVPQGSEARIRMEPIGRNDGAILDKPVSLYEVTEPTSYRRLGRSWQEVLE
jgi:hypothetical protein